MRILFDRKFLMRFIAIVVILILAVVLFFIGKQHTVLLDNKTITVNGKEIQALKLVEVQVNKLEALEFYPRDRDKVEVTRQKHSITISYTTDSWEEVTITRKFTLPLMEEMVMISIPALVANPEAPQSLWLEKYELPTYAVRSAPEDEVVVTDDLSGLISL